MAAPLAPPPGVFDILDLSPRLGAVQCALERASCDALVVTCAENIAYLTGFTGSAGMLFIGSTGALLCSDGRYRDQAAEQTRAASVDIEIAIGSISEQLAAIEGRLVAPCRLGFEAHRATFGLIDRFSRALSAEMVPTTGVIERLRAIKEPGEIARIEFACEIADRALSETRARLSEEVTESEFAAELEFAMRRLGSSAASFETIVASGPNGACPHARPTRRMLRPGDLVVIDFGAVFDGYHSDMTRTVCLGEPKKAQEDHYDAVLEAQADGVSAVRPGVTGAEVDAVCRRVLERLGYGAMFTHGTGHGVGREIHEAPSIGAGSPDSLSAGMIVTVEPGAYLPHVGGVRIEDTLVVTETGARSLTRSTKEFQL